MKKTKKFLALCLATAMLLGMTLTVNAATINSITANGVKYTVNSSTTTCYNCRHSSAVLRQISPAKTPYSIFYILSWNCVYCSSAFTSKA